MILNYPLLTGVPLKPTPFPALQIPQLDPGSSAEVTFSTLWGRKVRGSPAHEDQSRWQESDIPAFSGCYWQNDCKLALCVGELSFMEIEAPITSSVG